MTSKYEPLTAYLRNAADRAQASVEMSFAEIASLVGGLPASAASTSQWWANSSHSQALAWREAGYHVEQAYLDRGQVRFELGRRGGTWHDSRSTAGVASRATVVRRTPEPQPPRAPIGAPVDVHVVLQWTATGAVTLDPAGKPFFGALESRAGLYRMTVTGAGLARPKIYIGETDNLRRRLSGNYRNPGPRQQTSLRINALLCEHLGAGGSVALAVATEVDLRVAGVAEKLDLTRKAARLLAENAALVTQQVCDDAEIVNLG
jgi:hypothetical protein